MVLLLIRHAMQPPNANATPECECNPRMRMQTQNANANPDCECNKHKTNNNLYREDAEYFANAAEELANGGHDLLRQHGAQIVLHRLGGALESGSVGEIAIETFFLDEIGVLQNMERGYAVDGIVKGNQQIANHADRFHQGNPKQCFCHENHINHETYRH